MVNVEVGEVQSRQNMGIFCTTSFARSLFSEPEQCFMFFDIIIQQNEIERNNKRESYEFYFGKWK